MRKPRELREGAQYHVIARVNRQEHIFHPCKHKKLFLDIVRRAKKRKRFAVFNFCIMDNHIHFILAPQQGESLSKIMQWILSVFAMRFNKMYGYKGHVWYDRFKSKPIDNLKQYLLTFIYIAENPVRSGMVCRPDQYEYGGINFLRNKEYEIIEPPDEILKLILSYFVTPLMLQ